MLISFDVDGTMVFGDPPGPITLETVHKVKELGFVVGSASNRTIAEQSKLWREAGIEVDFVSLKHRLADLKERFVVAGYLHIGDTDEDCSFAERAGFDFLWCHQVPIDGSPDWLLDLARALE